MMLCDRLNVFASKPAPKNVECASGDIYLIVKNKHDFNNFHRNHMACDKVYYQNYQIFQNYRQHVFITFVTNHLFISSLFFRNWS